LIGSGVVSRDGVEGIIEADPAAGNGQVRIRTDVGHHLIVDSSLLRLRDDGRYDLPLDLRPVADSTERIVVVPVMAEELRVGKRRVITGAVRVTKRIHEQEEVVDEPSYREEVEVERVAVNRIVDATEESRYEGNTLVIPLYEEAIVVQRRLVLREELRLTTRRRRVREPQRVILRREEAQIERIDERSLEEKSGST
jgi:uncharacterized protein (TIGR02271 family)